MHLSPKKIVVEHIYNCSSATMYAKQEFHLSSADPVGTVTSLSTREISATKPFEMSHMLAEKIIYQ